MDHVIAQIAVTSANGHQTLRGAKAKKLRADHADDPQPDQSGGVRIQQHIQPGAEIGRGKAAQIADGIDQADAAGRGRAAQRPVGRVQNRAGDTISPQAATLSAISATSGEDVTADTARPAPDTASASAPMPRELPRLSHQGGMMVVAISAQAQGMAETKPTSSPMVVPSSLATWAGR